MAKKLYSFRETHEFEKRVYDYLSDDSYADLQFYLIENPDVGDVIVGSGGLRKFRWRAKGRGKRGGLRVVYYWADSHGYIYMVTIYSKKEKDDLTKDEIEMLRGMLEDWL